LGVLKKKKKKKKKKKIKRMKNLYFLSLPVLLTVVAIAWNGRGYLMTDNISRVLPSPPLSFIQFFLPEAYVLDEPTLASIKSSQMRPYDGELPPQPQISTASSVPELLIGPHDFGLMVKCHSNNNVAPGSTTSADDLHEWVKVNAEWLREKYYEFGAVLFRNCNVNDAAAFEKVIVEFEPNLATEYLGASPRTRVNGTSYVHTASEIPYYRSIPPHLEMSFKVNPPRFISFYAEKPNEGPGGQTPLVDVARVYDEMDPDFRARVEEKQVRYLRWYYNDEEGAPITIDPLKTKSWQAMFNTKNRSVVLETSEREEFKTEWNKHGDVLLENVRPGVHNHPITGRPTWNNHLFVFHGSTVDAQSAFSAQIEPSLQSLVTHFVLRGWVALRKFVFGEGHVEALGYDVTYGDGTPMSNTDVLNLRKLALKYTWVYDHQKGDFVMIDNNRIAHGREPWFRSEPNSRRILVAWI
jgi:alpha-ketoglutarate-dependent taurine dioxygenase